MACYFVQLIWLPILFYPAAVAAEEGGGPSTPETSTMAETDGQDAATSVCPNTGSCCVAHGGQGCEDASCCETVCNFDNLCCLTGWTADCAALAEILCENTCAGSCPGEGSCCESHAGGGCEDAKCCHSVCLKTPSCCEAIWSNTCANLAIEICDGCDEPPPSPCPTEAEGDCCEDHYPGVGCENENCCEIVCEKDPVCCSAGWDLNCLWSALDFCPNICQCATFGDFDGNVAVNLRDIAAFLVCFTGEGNSPVASGCECADYDADDDADLDDYAPFAALLVR